MKKIKECDNQEALKLDEYFKQTLVDVRPHILKLRSIEEAHLCRIWLDKLTSIISQRNLRNEYLLELSRQLRVGVLEGIFKTQPPNDSLMPLPSSCHAMCVSSSSSELSNYDRNNYDYLVNEKSNQSNYKQKFCDPNLTCRTLHIYCHDENAIEKDHLKFCQHRIDILTTALENFRIQNEQLKQELTKCQKNVTDDQPLQLQNHVKQLMSQVQNLAWKIRIFKKSIAKLRKLNNSIEHTYEKKLRCIIKNKNLQIKALQLQFDGQLSKLCLSLCSEKQDQLHILVGSLEEKYKALLKEANATIENQRQEYLTKITALEAELYHLRSDLRSNSN